MEQQIHNENVCARIFLDYLESQQNVGWIFSRAEEVFPELANRTRWEFVARRHENVEDWIAIEVKSLVISEAESQFSNWHKLVSDVNNRLEPKLRGKFWLVGLPRYNFDQDDRKKLLVCLEAVVEKANDALETNEMLDIGPEIKTCFRNWPRDTRKQPTGIDPKTSLGSYPPHRLLLLKNSNEGNSLRIGMHPVQGYWTEPSLERAVGNLLEGNERANTQLGLAKENGASRTVLLLDERIDFDPEVVCEALKGLDSSHLSNIDEVYLVSTFGGEHVAQVFCRDKSF